MITLLVRSDYCDGNHDFSDTLWDVTPDQFAKRQWGHIYLIPARPLYNVDGRWEAQGNINVADRNDRLKTVLDQMLDRAAFAAHGVGCVILDCGAESAPLVSAAFARGSHSWIVAIPDGICFHNIDAVLHEHKQRFPSANLMKARVILNRVMASFDRTMWREWRPLAYVPEDQKLYKDWIENKLEFDLGYDSVAAEIRRALSQTFLGRHRRLVPEEVDIRVGPWLRLLFETGLIDRLLTRRFIRKVRAFQLMRVALLFMVICSAIAGVYKFATSAPEVGAIAAESIEVESEADAKQLIMEIQAKGSLEALIQQSTNNPGRGPLQVHSREGLELRDFEIPPAKMARFVSDLHSGQVLREPLRYKGKYRIVRVLDAYYRKDQSALSVAVALIASLTIWIASLVFLVWFWDYVGELRAKLKLLRRLRESGSDKLALGRIMEDVRAASLRQSHMIWLRDMIDQERRSQQALRAGSSE